MTHEEHQYLALVQRAITDGEPRNDRTGTGTHALFAPPALRFALTNASLPLLTTKRTYLRGIVEELLWFIRGKTDATLLSQRGVKIWDGNGSKAFLESRGLGHRREGDLGPVYGFQWRHFGAPYVDCDADYTGQGVDQLQECIDKIRQHPTDRRIILSAWNPAGERASRLMGTCGAIDGMNSDPRDGASAVSYDVPVLCAHGIDPGWQKRALVSHVPTLR